MAPKKKAREEAEPAEPATRATKRSLPEESETETGPMPKSNQRRSGSAARPITPEEPTVSSARPQTQKTVTLKVPTFWPTHGKVGHLTPLDKPTLARFQEQQRQNPSKKSKGSSAVHKSSIYHDLHLPLHGGYLNLSKLDDFVKPNWYSRKANRYDVHMPASEIQSGTRAMRNPKAQEQRMANQTLAYHVSADAPSATDMAAILGYDSPKTLAQHTDNEVSDLFGPICMWKYEDKYLSSEDLNNWSEIYQMIPTLFTDPRYASLFTALANSTDDLPPLRIRRGDTRDPLARSKDEARESDVKATVLAAALLYLKQVRTAQGARRYTQHPISPIRPGGFEIDDWLRAILHLIYCLNRRKNKNPLDGVSGPTGQTATLQRFAPTDTPGLLTRDQHDLVPGNVAALKHIRLSGIVRRSALPSTEARMPNYGRVIASRVWARQSMLMATNPFAHLDRKAIGAKARKEKKKRDRARGERHVVNLDGLTLSNILDKMYRDGRFEPPVITEQVENIAETFRALYEKDSGDLHAYMATQDAMVEDLATIHQEPGETVQEARQRVEQSIRNCHAILDLTQKKHPWHKIATDSELVIEGSRMLGLYRPDLPDEPGQAGHQDGDEYSWSNMALNADAGLTLKPHQLMDAAIMRRLKKTPLRGSLCANDVGTGKTFTFFSVVVAQVIADREIAARGDTVDARPTMLVVPAGLVSQTFEEASKKFRDLLDIKVFYGSQKSCGKDQLRAAATLTQAEFDDEMRSCIRHRGQPETGKRVYITTYSTITKRWLRKNQVQYDPEKIVGPWELDKYTILEQDTSGRPGQADAGQPSGAQDTDEDEDAESDENDEVEEDHDEQEERPADRPEEEPVQHAGEGSGRASGKKSKLRVTTQFELCMTSVPGVQFARVIVDEAQVIRNPFSAYSRAIGLLPKRTIHMVSATPTLNKLDDMRGLSLHIWQTAKIPFREYPRDSFADMVNPKYDPDTPTGPLAAKADDDMKAGLDDIFQRGHRWFLLHPDAQKLISSDMADLAEPVFRASAAFTTRRGMDTRLLLPSGLSVFPGQDIRPHRVVTEELAYRKRYVEVCDTVQSLLEDLPTIHADDHDDTCAPDDGGDDGGDEHSAALNMAILRALWMLSQDYNSFCMLKSDDPLSSMSSKDMGDALANAGIKLKTLNGSTRKGMKAALAGTGGATKPVVALGTEHIEAVVADCDDGGLSWIYSSLSPDHNSVPPEGRPEMVHWGIAESPLFTRALQIALANKEEGERTLFMVNSPWAQQLLAALLTKASFNTISIRSGNTPQERANMVADWNNPLSGLDCAVLTMSISSAGLNLHKACCRGVLLQYPWNMGTIQQVFGRLIRIGQEKEVLWRVLRVNGTLYDWMEDKLAFKFVRQVMSEIRMPLGLEKCWRLRQLIGYEVIRVMMTQPFNRYSWVVSPPKHIRDYNDDRHRRMGQFYSMIVRLLMQDDVEDKAAMTARIKKLSHIVHMLGPYFVDSFYEVAIKNNEKTYTPFDLAAVGTWEYLDSLVDDLMNNEELQTKYRNENNIQPVGSSRRNRPSEEEHRHPLSSEWAFDDDDDEDIANTDPAEAVLRKAQEKRDARAGKKQDEGELTTADLQGAQASVMATSLGMSEPKSTKQKGKAPAA